MLCYSVYEDDAHAVNPNSVRERKLQQQVGVVNLLAPSIAIIQISHSAACYYTNVLTSTFLLL